MRKTEPNPGALVAQLMDRTVQRFALIYSLTILLGVTILGMAAALWMGWLHLN